MPFLLAKTILALGSLIAMGLQERISENEFSKYTIWSLAPVSSM